MARKRAKHSGPKSQHDLHTYPIALYVRGLLGFRFQLSAIKLRGGRDFIHLIGVSRGYKVGFAAGRLLHSVAKVLRDASGVRVFENVREDIGRWVESTRSLPR